MKYIISFCLLLLTISASSIEHNTVLPHPQKISYGRGKIEIKGLNIGFGSKPNTEDKFAARELVKIFSKITLTDTPVNDSPASGSSIIFERTGDSDPLPVPGEMSGPDTRESYRIKVTPKNIRITAKSTAGLFYAVQTLRQMIEGTGNDAFIPEVEVEDWPSLVYRGFMMDMSHFQFPKIEEIKNQIDFLAFWKGNQYLFYSEASIELDGYPLLMAEARYTKEQVRDIIDYAKDRHVDVIPNMELYGHLHDLFRLEHYSDMSVVPHGGEFIPDDQRVSPLLDDWITQISRLFPSPFFHIGFDETWSLEFEARKRNKTPEELYLHMLKQTTDIVEREGKHAMVWADMLQKYPSIIPKVSKKMIAVPWHYSAMDDIKYEQLLSPFEKSGIPMIVQGALVNWNWVSPAFELSFLNTDVLIAAGKKYNAIGFINSGWTDDPLTLMRTGFPDIAYGSVAAWQKEPVDRANFFINYARVQYSSELADIVGTALNSLSQGESLIRKAVGSTDPALWANPFTARSQKMIESNKENLHYGRLAVEDAEIQLRNALKYGIDNVSLTALLAGAKMLDYIALKYLYAGEIGGFWKQLGDNPGSDDFRLLINRETRAKYHSRCSDMMDAILETKDLFLKAWQNEYTSYRIGIAVGKYDLEFQFWLKFQRRLESLNYREGETLPPLESLVVY
jgi:hexosaminidase